jgi:hypothetical protein
VEEKDRTVRIVGLGRDRIGVAIGIAGVAVVRRGLVAEPGGLQSAVAKHIVQLFMEG